MEQKMTLVEEYNMLESRIDELYKNKKEPTPTDWYKKNISPLMRRQREIEEELKTLKAQNIKIGDYISISPYTDWQSYKVVKRTAKTITCQRNRQLGFKESWEDGEMNSEDDPEGSLIVLRWSNKHNWWSYGRYYKVALGKRDYRDPSF